MTSTDSKIDTSGAEDNLFLIDSGKPREIHVSIAQEDYPQARHCVSQPVHVRMGTRPAIPSLRAPDLLPGPWPVVCFARGVSRRIYVDLGGVRLAELMWK